MIQCHGLSMNFCQTQALVKPISNFIIIPYKKKPDTFFFFNPGTLDCKAPLFGEGVVSRRQRVKDIILNDKS